MKSRQRRGELELVALHYNHLMCQKCMNSLSQMDTLAIGSHPGYRNFLKEPRLRKLPLIDSRHILSSPYSPISTIPKKDVQLEDRNGEGRSPRVTQRKDCLWHKKVCGSPPQFCQRIHKTVPQKRDISTNVRKL